MVALRCYEHSMVVAELLSVRGCLAAGVSGWFVEVGLLSILGRLEGTDTLS